MNTETRRSIHEYYMCMTPQQVSERNKHVRNGCELAHVYLSSLEKLSVEESKKIKDHVSHDISQTFVLSRIRAILKNADIYSFSQGEHMHPHTHGNTIFIPKRYLYVRSTSTMAMTITHECIHIFQRLYPIETQVFLMNVWGLEMIGYDEKNKGTNPDINAITYVGKRGMVHDHPFEDMAYTLTDIIWGKSTPTHREYDWITKYL